MCEYIYGKIVVLLLIMPLSVMSVLAIWYGIEIFVDKICRSANKEIKAKCTKRKNGRKKACKNRS